MGLTPAPMSSVMLFSASLGHPEDEEDQEELERELEAILSPGLYHVGV